MKVQTFRMRYHIDKLPGMRVENLDYTTISTNDHQIAIEWSCDVQWNIVFDLVVKLPVQYEIWEEVSIYTVV